jgi:hypothetical protein
MRLKFIAIMASVGALGLASAGCVAEGGGYHSDYRAPVVHKSYSTTTVVRRHDDRHNWRRDRDRDHRRHDDHRRGDHDRDGRHSSRDHGDHHDRCRPGEKHCDRHM